MSVKVFTLPTSGIVPRSINAASTDNVVATADTEPAISLSAFTPKHTVPERVRQAISTTQRKRWKDNAELRAQVSAKLKVSKGSLPQTVVHRHHPSAGPHCMEQRPHHERRDTCQNVPSQN